MSHRPILLSLLFALVLVAVPAAALTYVPMEDGALADSAGVIAEVRVIDSSFARVGGRPYTDYQLEVDRVVKGGVSGSTLVVRVPGGRAPSGLSLEIQGAPRFRAGERALVFLSASEDGTYRLTQLSLSLFHIVDQGGQTYAARNLQGAHAMAMPGRRTPVRDGLRDYTEFRRWLEDRAVGLRTNADYFREVPTGTLQAIVDRFTLFEDGGTGLNFRWQEFDTGDPVTFFAHEGGQPGLTGGGFQEFQDSLAAWNADPGSSINLQYGGTTSLTGGLTLPCDVVGACPLDQLVNAIVFDDPNDNPLFGGDFNCASGGVIAAGGPWFDTTMTHVSQGTEYITILSADIVTNVNVGCFLSQNNSAREVFAHELGHTLGLGHSCADTNSGPCNTTAKDEALMRALAHGDGRGAQLGTDDRAAVAFLYPVTTGTCIPGDTTLCLNNDRFRVEVNWRNVAGTTGQGHGVELTGDTGYFWFFNPSNVEMVVKVLNGCPSTFNSYWVFAGGLTNVEVEMVVTDTEHDEVRTYTNPLRTPFQPLQDTEAFLTCP